MAACEYMSAFLVSTLAEHLRQACLKFSHEGCTLACRSKLQVERLSRQAKEQTSKGEVLEDIFILLIKGQPVAAHSSDQIPLAISHEDRLSSQAKGMEACREAGSGVVQRVDHRLEAWDNIGLAARLDATCIHRKQLLPRSTGKQAVEVLRDKFQRNVQDS